LNITIIFGCQKKLTSTAINKKGMIKVTIFYPGGEGKKFDMEYYSTKHIPLVQSLFGDAMKGASIDKGIAVGTSGASTFYVAIGYLYFENISAYEEGFKINAQKILADIPNYTNITPVVQISEVVQ
jgi:uncharacterized protein (TIGR02118 family)